MWHLVTALLFLTMLNFLTHSVLFIFNQGISASLELTRQSLHLGILGRVGDVTPVMNVRPEPEPLLLVSRVITLLFLKWKVVCFAVKVSDFHAKDQSWMILLAKTSYVSFFY